MAALAGAEAISNSPTKVGNYYDKANTEIGAPPARGAMRRSRLHENDWQERLLTALLFSGLSKDYEKETPGSASDGEQVIILSIPPDSALTLKYETHCTSTGVEDSPLCRRGCCDDRVRQYRVVCWWGRVRLCRRAVPLAGCGCLWRVSPLVQPKGLRAPHGD